MTNKELVKRAIQAATQFNTMYLSRTSGQPVTEEIKNDHRFEYHHGKKRTKLEAADETTFAFGNSGFLEAMLEGWNPGSRKAKTKAKDLPDKLHEFNAEIYRDACVRISDEFDYIEPGEILWMKGCIGIYVGDGKCVLSTESIGDGVQIAGVAGMTDEDIPLIRWQQHGRLPWITYIYDKKRTYIQVATEVMEGKWGLERRNIARRLEEQGYNARLIMSRVDERLEEYRNKTNAQIAAGVMIGKWGRTVREQNTRLIIAGYNPVTIRSIIGKINRGEL